jgi:uncharacterized protein YceH (UPF0502 family)
MPFGMAESNESKCDTTLCCELLRRPGKDEKRLAALFFPDVDVAPTHRFADGVGWHSNILRIMAVNSQGCDLSVRN